jgi:hypothetical protein
MSYILGASFIKQITFIFTFQEQDLSRCDQIVRPLFLSLFQDYMLVFLKSVDVEVTRLTVLN